MGKDSKKSKSGGEAEWSYADMSTIIPEGESGIARVDHFEIGDEEIRFSVLRSLFNNGRGVPLEKGIYARLMVGGRLMMSDTTEERSSNKEAVANACGDVLIAGLGLGMVLIPILEKEDVATVKVVEKFRDVIDLIGDKVKEAVGDNARKLTIVEGDIFSWKPPRGEKYDAIYFDIWPNIGSSNLKDMKKLHDKFRSRKRRGGWMESWNRKVIIKRQKDLREEAVMREKRYKARLATKDR